MNQHDLPSKKSIKIRAGIVTASDRASRKEREDSSGLLLRMLLEGVNAEVTAYQVLPDDRAALETALRRLADEGSCDLILTTGGTGVGPRDHTPEATRAVLTKEIPGIAEAIRQAGRAKTPWAMLTRGAAGIRGHCLIVNFPGSPGAVEDSFEVLKPVLGHVLGLIRGEVKDCGEERPVTWKGYRETLSRSAHSHF